MGAGAGNAGARNGNRSSAEISEGESLSGTGRSGRGLKSQVIGRQGRRRRHANSAQWNRELTAGEARDSLLTEIKHHRSGDVSAGVGAEAHGVGARGRV